MRCAMSAMASFSQRRVEGFNHISLLSLRPLNHRPLEGRQSSLSFIRPRDDHNAEIVLPSVAPFKRPDIESVAPAAGFGGGAHSGWRGPHAVLGCGYKH